MMAMHEPGGIEAYMDKGMVGDCAVLKTIQKISPFNIFIFLQKSLARYCISGVGNMAAYTRCSVIRTDVGGALSSAMPQIAFGICDRSRFLGLLNTFYKGEPPAIISAGSWILSSSIPACLTTSMPKYYIRSSMTVVSPLIHISILLCCMYILPI
jgi:hypothetical protein